MSVFVIAKQQATTRELNALAATAPKRAAARKNCGEEKAMMIRKWLYRLTEYGCGKSNGSWRITFESWDKAIRWACGGKAK